MIDKSIVDICKYLDKFYLKGPSLLELENKELLDKLTKLVSLER